MNIQSEQIRELSRQNPEYPDLLKDIHKAPETLYCRGREIKNDVRRVAIVGARKATAYGKWAAFEAAKFLAERGVCIVSGMAWGIDADAHRGALEGNGHTIAVLGSGVDICYPASHHKLMEEIALRGTLLSEFPPGTQCRPYHFPMRNRIISGLSEAVIIPEAGADSGSLITAAFALEQNREVYAFPGNVNSIYSKGCNLLIRDGARPITEIEELSEIFGLSSANVAFKADLSDDEQEIYELIREGGQVSREWLMRRTQIPCGFVLGILSVLEIKGMIRKDSGKIMIAI